ncbi:MAG: hypothetical protein PHP45_06295 [Elusimicrobiales bacterium]|nr:hypothetical protein [Elusimicrobiales bacterium]
MKKPSPEYNREYIERQFKLVSQDFCAVLASSREYEVSRFQLARAWLAFREICLLYLAELRKCGCDELTEEEEDIIASAAKLLKTGALISLAGRIEAELDGFYEGPVYTFKNPGPIPAKTAARYLKSLAECAGKMRAAAKL